MEKDLNRHLAIREIGVANKYTKRRSISHVNRERETETTLRNRLHVGSVTQSCLTLCDPIDCGPPGSSVHGILQARRLEWVAISSSRGSSQPRDRIRVSCIGRRILYLGSPKLTRNFSSAFTLDYGLSTGKQLPRANPETLSLS